MKHEHLLLIRFSSLGDVALLVPVVASLALQYPQLRITVLSRPFARPLFEGLAHNVSFMEADVKDEYRGMRGLNSLFRRLAAKHFTGVADLHGVLRTDYLCMRFRLGHYRVARIDKHRRGRRLLTRANDKSLKQQPTAIDNYRSVLSQLNYPLTLSFRSIFGQGKADLSMLPDDLRHHADDEPWIGIAPFAAHRGKIYPEPQMEQVVELLCRRHPRARLFFFGGGKNEIEVFDRWCTQHTQCINASKRLGGMRSELALMSHLNVMLSMDSANMHLASLTGIPVVSIWGATHPYAGFMGYGQDESRAVQADLPCRPCSIFGNKSCRRGDYACLTSIAPEQVVSRVEHFL